MAGLTVLKRPLSKNYQLSVGELRSYGHLEIMFVLNSWRDPRGKTIPKGEEARYFIPESGPKLTYIHGHFRYRIAEKTIEKIYYAPLQLRDDKTVSLGNPGPTPTDLLESIGFE